MAERKNTHGLAIRRCNGVTVLDIGPMEIWDGADLSLIRDTLNQVIGQKRHQSVGIDMGAVKYVPSGFFGMLYDWYDQGISVRLFSPQPRVMNMLWFQHFFEWECDETFLLRENGACLVDAEDGSETDEWDREPLPMSRTTPPAELETSRVLS